MQISGLLICFDVAKMTPLNIKASNPQSRKNSLHDPGKKLFPNTAFSMTLPMIATNIMISPNATELDFGFWVLLVVMSSLFLVKAELYWVYPLNCATMARARAKSGPFTHSISIPASSNSWIISAADCVFPVFACWLKSLQHV